MSNILCVIALSILSLSFTEAKAQEIIGPKNAATKELVKLKISKFDNDVANDPKILCSPENNDWTLYKTTTDGSLEIVFYTNKPNTYTFTLASNKSNKTTLLIHSIVIGKADPNVPTPVPVIIPNKLKDDLKAAYLVSPDADKRAILLKVYQDVLAQSDDLENFGQAGQLLSNLTAKRQAKTDDLRAVKDTVEKYLLSELTGDGDKWDKEKFKSTFTNIITVLADLRP